MIQQFYPVPPHSYPYELNKDFHFAAAHYLPDERAGKCQNMHGHTYFVNITIVGRELDELGMLVDFSTLKRLIHKRFDHDILNEHLYMPTTEQLAAFIYTTVERHLADLPHRPNVLQTLVRETPTSYAIYRGEKT